jgi:hypothetical protein
MDGGGYIGIVIITTTIITSTLKSPSSLVGHIPIIGVQAILVVRVGAITFHIHHAEIQLAEA